VSATTCKVCGLPKFDGPAGYCGPQCKCEFKTLPQMYDNRVAEIAELKKEIESLRQQLALMQQDRDDWRARAEWWAGKWQPIESAPKDGSFILLWERFSSSPFVGYWLKNGGWYPQTEFVLVIGDAYLTDNISQSLITHWMPLPNPPANEEKQ